MSAQLDLTVSWDRQGPFYGCSRPHLCQALASTHPGHPGGPLPRSSVLASTNTLGDTEVRVPGPEAGCQHGVDLESFLRSLGSWASELRRSGVVDKPCEGRRGSSRAMEQQVSRAQTLQDSDNIFFFPQGATLPWVAQELRPLHGRVHTQREMHSK